MRDAIGPVNEHLEKLTGTAPDVGDLGEYWRKWVEDARGNLGEARKRLEKVRDCKQKDELGRELGDLEGQINQREGQLETTFDN